MRIDLKQLTTFVAVAESGSLARASERLHLTQAALSMQLKSLQEALAVQLLTRTGRGLRLTDDGERLLAHAREAVAAANLFEKAAGALAQAPAAEAEPVSIGTILDPGFIRLGELMRTITTLLPGYRTELRHGTSGWVLKEVRAKRLDMGFYLGEADPALFVRMKLARLRYVVLGPRGWGAQMAARGWRELASLPWVWTPPDSVHHRLLAPLFRDLRVKPNAVANVDQEASMLDLVRAGVGLSLVREDVAIKEAHLSGLALSRAHHVETDLSVIVLRERAEEPALRTLFEAVAAVWQPERG